MAVKPVVYDDSTKKHRPLGSGERMDGLSASSIISADSGNLITTGSDGLVYATGSGVIDPAADNLLEATSGGKIKLDMDRFVGWLGSHRQDAAALAAGIPVVSGDSGNIVSSGADSGAFLGAEGAAAALESVLSSSGAAQESLVSSVAGALSGSGADLGGARAAASGTDVLRSFSDRFGDVANVRDFGAAGDGETDDTAAWHAWQDALSEGGMGFVPAGSYLVDGKIFSVPDGMIGNGDAAFSIDADFPNRTGLAKSQLVNHGRHGGDNPEPVAAISNVVRPESGVSEDVLVVIVAGASNAAGSASLGALHENFPEAGKFWDWCRDGSGMPVSNPRWAPLVDPTAPTARVGMDISIALTLHDLAQKPVYIINVARGASGLYADCAWSWNASPSSGSHSCRDMAQTQITNALAAIAAGGLTYRLLGVVWVEREAKNVAAGLTTMSDFRANQLDLNRWWYTTIGAPKIFTAECNYDGNQDDAAKAVMDEGNALLRELAGDDENFVLATKRYLDVVPARDTWDGTHFYAVSYRRFGQDFAHAIFAGLVGDLPVSSGLAGDATPVCLHAKSALAGDASMSIHSVAGAATHVASGGHVQGVYGMALKSCASGAGYAVGVRGKGSTMAPEDASGIVAGGMFEIENWARDSVPGSIYSYATGSVRCGVLVRCQNYGTENEAGIMVAGPITSGTVGCWNAILVSRSAFAGANGKAGTVALNMSSFANENYPETALAFGRAKRHITLNNDTELRIHARTTEFRGQEGGTYAQIRIISSGEYAGIALCTMSDSTDRTSEHVLHGSILWHPSESAYGYIGLRLKNPSYDPDDAESVENVNSLYIGSDSVYPRAGSDLGFSGSRWDTIYATNGTIDTSDENAKQDIGDIPEAVLRAWGRVQFQQFRYRDAVAEKGADARVHVGVIAQRVKEAFESEGLDPFRYGLLCYDEWEDMYEDETVVDVEEHVDEATGETVPAQTHVERRLVVPAGSAYGIRYTEALALECAYQRWLGEQRDARVAALEARLQ